MAWVAPKDFKFVMIINIAQKALYIAQEALSVDRGHVKPLRTTLGKPPRKKPQDGGHLKTLRKRYT